MAQLFCFMHGAPYYYLFSLQWDFLYRLGIGSAPDTGIVVAYNSIRLKEAFVGENNT